MNDIPVYLKTSTDMPRPTDPEFYWITPRRNLFGAQPPVLYERCPGTESA